MVSLCLYMSNVVKVDTTSRCASLATHMFPLGQETCDLVLELYEERHLWLTCMFGWETL